MKWLIAFAISILIWMLVVVAFALYTDNLQLRLGDAP